VILNHADPINFIARDLGDIARVKGMSQVAVGNIDWRADFSQKRNITTDLHVRTQRFFVPSTPTPLMHLLFT
jgi:hypothetical protein